MEIDEKTFWQKLLHVIESEPIPKRRIYEIPLPILGYLLWPEKDYNQLKYLNRVLAQLLRSRRIKIIRRHGVRYAQIPIDRIQKKKREESKVLVEAVWRW